MEGEGDIQIGFRAAVIKKHIANCGVVWKKDGVTRIMFRRVVFFIEVVSQWQRHTKESRQQAAQTTKTNTQEKEEREREERRKKEASELVGLDTYQDRSSPPHREGGEI